MQNFNFALKAFLKIQVFLYRLTNGRIGGEIQGLRVLLLTTVGAKTGKRRTNSLGFFEYEDGYVISGSNLGLDTHPAWYFNIKHNPEVEIQVMGKKMTAQSEVVTGKLRQELWGKLMSIAPGYGDYQRRTTREIPLLLLRPER